MKITRLLAVVAGLLVLAACGGAPSAAPVSQEVINVAGGSYTNISVTDLQSMLLDKDFLFVNVHIPFEGDIAGTDVSIPFDTIDAHLDQLPADKDEQIVLYCRSGRMSEIAAQTLVGLGYTNVYNVTGGMIAWEQAGQPIER